MSRGFVGERGHVGLYVGPDVVGSRTIGLQVEDERGAGPSRALLTPSQACEIALELLERCFNAEVAAAVRRSLEPERFR